MEEIDTSFTYLVEYLVRGNWVPMSRDYYGAIIDAEFPTLAEAQLFYGQQEGIYLDRKMRISLETDFSTQVVF